MTEINWELIDKIVFINLAKRADRLHDILNELKKVKAPAEKIIRFEAIEETEGALGCAKSHLGVLRMARMHGWNNVLILEDDMVFENDEPSIGRLNFFLNQLTCHAWDVGLLSGSYFVIKQVKECFYKVEWTYLANSYLVNQSYYEKLMQNYSQSIYRMEEGEHRNKAGLDVNWLKLMAKDNWYGVYPCIGYQRAGPSDIEHQDMDRREYFRRTLEEIKRYGSF